MKKALVTGASSGIGREFARQLSTMGYELILTARRTGRLEQLQEELKTPTRIITADLSSEQECLSLYEQTKDDGVDVLINCAGSGVFGPFLETSLERELSMNDVNIRALHILTKLFCRDFAGRGTGRILNVSSSAAFQPGPLFSSYYASKAYVLRLTEALAEELRRGSNSVSVSVLCPGPVETEFDGAAGVKPGRKGLSAECAAACGLRGMFAGKTVIVPGVGMKAVLFGERFLPERAVVRLMYRIQRRKSR